jgi:integrase
MSKAVRWGVVATNPLLGLEMLEEKPRERYIEDWELTEFLSVAPLFLQLYIPIKLITGLSKSDILRIKLTDIQADGLHAVRSKVLGRSGKRKIYPLFDADGEPNGLSEAIEAVRQFRRQRVGSVYLFATRDGQPYLKEDGTTSGFDSIWQRTMQKALEATRRKERFTEHDLRAGWDLM